MLRMIFLIVYNSGDLMKKVFIFICCYFIMFLDVGALEINSKYAVLYNLSEDNVLYEVNKDQRTSVASLTKIMTTIVAIENINDYDCKVVLKQDMFNGLKEAHAATIGLFNNQTVTYNDLLYGMFLASGADATRAIAITISGSENEFVKLMNKKANELGLVNTNFSNTIGLDTDNHYSTVDEIAKILKYALKNTKFREIFFKNEYTFSDGSFTVFNTMRKTANAMGIDTSYILGAKTGYTNNAGRCLASIAVDTKNDISYLLVTTNSDSYFKPIMDAVNIYNYYFENFRYQYLVKRKDLLISIPVKYSKVKKVDFYASFDIKKYLPNDFSISDVFFKYEGEDIISPVSKKNLKVGAVNVFYKNELVDTIDIILDKDIDFSIIIFVKDNIFIFAVVLFFVGICFYVLRIRKK